MLRACLLAFPLLAAAVSARAADLPKDISPDARAEFLAQLKGNYAKARGDLLAEIEDARTLAKFKATEAEGKKKLALADMRLAQLEKSPLNAAGKLLGHIGESPKAGTVGTVAAGEFLATATSAEGVLVTGLLAGDDKIVVQYLIASPLKLPKPAGKKDPPVSMNGIWYVAGTTEVKGKAVPVLYRFADLSKAETADIKAAEKK